MPNDLAGPSQLRLGELEGVLRRCVGGASVALIA